MGDEELFVLNVCSCVVVAEVDEFPLFGGPLVVGDVDCGSIIDGQGGGMVT